jgi:hypothetical protein
MSTTWKYRMALTMVTALVAGAWIAGRYQPARGERLADPAAYPRYSIIETQGHNLIVTDNQSNTLYFYTIDKDKEIGTELKLRGQVDLNQVGKPEIKLTRAK